MTIRKCPKCEGSGRYKGKYNQICFNCNGYGNIDTEDTDVIYKYKKEMPRRRRY